jgi:hypothetical protein
MYDIKFRDYKKERYGKNKNFNKERTVETH